MGEDMRIRRGAVTLAVAIALALATSVALAQQPVTPEDGSEPAAVEPAQPAPAAAEPAQPAPAATDGARVGPDGAALPPPAAEQPATEQAAAATTAAAGQDAAATDGEGAGAATTAKEEPPVETQVQGTCLTPRQAWLQLLYWLRAPGDRWEAKRAAGCFDARHLSPEEAGRRAIILKKVLDRKPTWVKVDDIPNDPEYLDGNGQPRYVDPVVAGDYEGIELVRINGRWLFSARTIDLVPSLYPSLTSRVEAWMPGWMKEPYLGIEAWKYLAVILLIFLALTVQKLVTFIIGTYVRRLIRGFRQDWIKKAVNRADRPIGGLVMAGVFHIGFPMLMFPPRISEVAMVATEALAAYSIVWLAYRMIDVLTDVMQVKADATESKLDDQLVPLVSRTLKVFVSVVGFIFILQNLDVDVGSLLAGLGLGGLAFALAAKDTVANFFGSVMIFIDKPFQIGDWVVISGVEGIVEEVGFRTSRVRTFYNSQVTVPNALVTSAMVDNYGRRQYRRYSTSLGLCYDTPPDKLQAFCEGVRAIIAGMPSMRKDYYLVEFKEFGPSSLDIMIYCFFEVTSFNDEMRGRTRLNLEILRLAEELGVSFAFPTQTLHIDSMVQPGQARASHQGPSDAAALIGIIDAFAPGGGKSRPTGARLSQGYDNSPKWIDHPSHGTGDADGEG
jgi:MscS family membrane protein